MCALPRRVFIAAGYNTTYYGSGRKEFNPKQMPGFESYLLETALGTSSQLQNPDFDEGFIGTFMSGRFLKQANFPGFLPFMVPSLKGKPCTGIEGACGTGGRTIAAGMRSVLSGMADSVFIAGIEMQNTMKAVYGADVLAGAAYYRGERKKGHAFFFPGIFSDRAGAYYKKYGYDVTRQAMAKWYENAILNARKNPKAQEYHNTRNDLLAFGMLPPNPNKFVPHLNQADCSKVSDGASSLLVLSEKGLKKCGINREDAVEIIGIGEAERDITKPPTDLTVFDNTALAVRKAFESAALKKEDLGILEIHDCFSISAILAFEAIGFAAPGKGPDFILEGHPTKDVPTNLSGGLGGFGHPTGATGVRQMVDLLHQLTHKAENQVKVKAPYGMMISMGGNDVTVTAVIVTH